MPTRNYGYYPTNGTATMGADGWIIADHGTIRAETFAEAPVQQPIQDEEVMIKETIKSRHLSGAERVAYHKPKSDWYETPAGEVCRSADTLTVVDILKKHGLAA